MAMDREELRERYEHAIERIVAQLCKTYGPEKIILFGSCARGDFGEDSDIDLLIVKETALRPLAGQSHYQGGSSIDRSSPRASNCLLRGFHRRPPGVGIGVIASIEWEKWLI